MEGALRCDVLLDRGYDIRYGLLFLGSRFERGDRSQYYRDDDERFHENQRVRSPSIVMRCMTLR